MGVQGNGKSQKYERMGSEEEIVLTNNLQHKLAEEEKGSIIDNVNSNASQYVLACAIFASLNSVLLGYDVGVMSGAIIFIQEDLKISEFQEEILVGILSIVSLLGSLAGGKASDAIGRKWTMALAAIVFQSGAAVMSLAPSFQVLMIGRLLAGIGIGFGVMIAPVYIAEISPSIARGSLTSFPEIFVNLGILLGYISNYAFSVLSVAFVHNCVPETKGKSLEQIEMLFQNEGELQGVELEMGDAERLVQKQ
ncbi:Sugar/inositol transporter [Corchorus olitorius]|uniref:Sugar/inositol transporter n=1 Tax=Corchorus olitorius TaxID=93759 RepID=A0A1R3H490_9ROSI|nr:Sugar/inositol transporter [Corchorus olitorius]